MHTTKKKCSRILALLLSLAMVLSLVPEIAMADDTDPSEPALLADDEGQSGTVGDVNWDLTGGVLTVFGTGSTGTFNVASTHPDFYSERDSITEIVIEDGVTDVGTALFYNLSKVTTVTMADSVTSLGNYSFESCTSLQSIELSDSITSIGQNAFNTCTSLESITIPAGVEEILNYTFRDSGITSITFTGSPPSFTSAALTGVTGTAYYPAANILWTSSVLSSQYGGSFTWVSYESGGVDKNALKTEIAATDTLYEENYTAASWATLQNALSTAREVLADDSASQDRVDEVTRSLMTAISSLAPVDHSGETKDVYVTKFEELEDAMQNGGYAGYDEVDIHLQADIPMTGGIAGWINNIVIDGSTGTEGEYYTLTGPEGSDREYKMFTNSGSTSDSLSTRNKTLTFENLNIDANRQYLIYTSSSYMANAVITLDTVKLINLAGSGTTYGAIYLEGSSNGPIGQLILNAVTTENCTGTLIYTNYIDNGISVKDSCLETTMDSTSGTTGCGIVVRYDGTTPELTLDNSTIQYTDTSSRAFRGIYAWNDWTVKLENGSAIYGTGNNSDSRAIYSQKDTVTIDLGDCTISNTDGTRAKIDPKNYSTVIKITGEVSGSPEIILKNGSGITVGTSLTEPIYYSYRSSISNTDPLIATGMEASDGNDGHPLSGDDLANLIFAEESSTRIPAIADDGNAYLYRRDISECDLSMVDPTTTRTGTDGTVTYVFEGCSTDGRIEPDVQALLVDGTVVSSSDYTVAYYDADEVQDGDGLSIDPHEESGAEKDATAVVTPQNELAGDPVTLHYIIKVAAYTDLGADDAPVSLDMYYDAGKNFTVDVYYNGKLLTEEDDYVASWSIDDHDYTATITIEGRGSYGGVYQLTVDLPGRDSKIRTVYNAETLDAALTDKVEQIYFSGNVTNLNNTVVVDYDATFYGEEYTLNVGGLTVDAGVTVVMTDISLKGSITVEEDAEMTLSGCTVSGGPILNYGALNVEEDTTLSDIQLNSTQASRRYMIYNDGILNWAGRFDVNYSAGIATTTNNATGSVIHNTENGTINMTGGEINGYIKSNGTYTDQRTQAFFGAIRNDGTLNMSGGTITGFSTNGRVTTNTNTDTTGGLFPGGGGVRNRGVFNMTGGVITGNTAENYSGTQNDEYSGRGGGVYNDWDSVFTMTGGEISENTATLGGGVFNIGPNGTEENSAGGTFTMTGGTIRDNMLSGDELEIGNANGGMMGRGDGAVNLSNAGSEICSTVGAVTTISGGTISGDDLIQAALTDADGNEMTTQIHAGIALDTVFNVGSGTNFRTSYTNSDDCSITVTGDPDIDVGIMLINQETWIQNAKLNSYPDNDEDKDDWDKYDYTTSGDPLHSEYWAWLWLDGGLSTQLTVDTLDIFSYTLHWTNSSVGMDVFDLNSTTLSRNNDRDVYAFYLDGVEPAESDGDLLKLSDGQTIYQLHFYELRENEANEEGMSSTTTVTTEKLFDYEAWQLCNHSVAEDIKWMDEIPASCEEYGTRGHYECAYCGAKFWDINGTVPMTDGEAQLKPLGHDIQWSETVDATCTKDGYEEGYVCVREGCGKFFFASGQEDTTGDRIIPATGHSWVDVPAVPATETTDGWTAYCECENCGEHWTEPEVIPATGVEADKTALEVAIEEAQALLDDADSPYTEDSLQALQAAVDAATEADEKDGISQTEVNNALTDLLDAVMALENGDSDEPDDTALQIAVDSAEALLEDEDSPYTDASLEDLAAVVEEAKAVLADPDASQEDIDAAVDAVIAAIQDMEKNPLPDTGELEAMIATTEAVMDQLAPSDYTEESWQALEDALSAAKDVAADPENQEAVDEALANLEDALSALKQTADKSALETLIEAAKELADSPNYTEESRNALSEVLAEAEAVFNNSDLTADDQSTVDNAASDLLQAIIGLEKAEPDTGISTAALEAAIAAAGALKEDNYTEKSWQALEEALTEAEAALEKCESQEAVDAAAVALMDAMGALDKVADMTALDAMIAATEDLNEQDYTELSWNNLQKALETARGLDPETASQDDVDKAADDLLKAIMGLEKAEVPVEKTGLETLIDQARALYPPEDEDKYDPDSWSALQDALAAAEDVLADDDATQDQVNAALQDLMTAVMNMETAGGGDTPNTSGLEIAIQSAETLLEEIEGSDTYTSDSVQKLDEAVKYAEDLLESGSYDSDDLSEAADNIMAAISGLVPNTAATQAEKNALQSAITAAEKLAGSSDYTSETVKALEDAIAEAEKVYQNSSATQNEVSDALEALTEAVNGLVKDETKTDEDQAALETVIETAGKLVESNYTADSWSAMQDALETAINVADDENATRSQVSEAMMALTEAINNLQEDETASADDKADLETVINAAENLNESSYTSDSWSAMQEALAAAQSVLSDSGATKDQVSKVMMELTLAISALVPTGSGGTTGGQSGTKDGFVYEDGEWHYYENNERFYGNDIKEDLKKTIDGTDGWYYIENSKVNFGYTGVSHFENAYGWWYVRNGKVDFSKNSVEQNQYGWWYVLGGKVDFSYTGVANYANDYGWWYLEKGKVNFGKTGVEPNSYGWWRVVDGKVDFSCNSVEQNDYGWWYLVGGKVDFGYTGVSNYANDYGWWYIEKGKVNFNKTSIEPNQYGWWRVVKGKVDFSCNSVEMNDYGWWYVTGGKVDFSYTGVSNYANQYGWWYISKGKVDFGFTGRASNMYGTWYCVNGKVDFSRS